MPAGCHKAYKGWFQFSMFNIVGTDMTADMVDSHQRNSACKADCLCLSHSHKQCPDQTGAISNCNGRNILKRQFCLSQSLLDYLIDLFNMLSGCNLRNDAAELRMQCNLGIDHIGKHLPAVFHNGCGSLITGAFNCQNHNIFFHWFQNASSHSKPFLRSYLQSSSNINSVVFPSFAA